ncbi:hypothetical protein ACRRVB_04085 [Candidatus Cardinium hertigii]|uniref:hypothetical protein n=1 Tax=Candidatus Cardinium hertigii TaxID=247481 RepID=UPI003D7D16C5
MAYKFNTLKSIKKGLIGPNILFPAAYLLFSAEVCTGGAKNKPSNQMGQVLHASLSAKPVVLQDKVVENLEQSKDKTEGVSTDSVDQSNTIEEDVEGSEGKAEESEEANPVNQSNREEGLKALEGKTETLAATKPDDKPKVDIKPVLSEAGGPAGVGVGILVAPTVSAPVGAGTPPPPPVPLLGALLAGSGAPSAAGVGTPPPPLMPSPSSPMPVPSAKIVKAVKAETVKAKTPRLQVTSEDIRSVRKNLRRSNVEQNAADVSMEHLKDNQPIQNEQSSNASIQPCNQQNQSLPGNKAHTIIIIEE